MSELIWNGKYDEKGDLKPVDRTILPFQVVETVNQPNATRAHTQGDLIWSDHIKTVPQASSPANSSPVAQAFPPACS